MIPVSKKCPRKVATRRFENDRFFWNPGVHGRNFSNRHVGFAGFDWVFGFGGSDLDLDTHESEN